MLHSLIEPKSEANLEYTWKVIIARSPLRISLGGGGTDLPSYYKDYEGFVLAAAIDKYIYVSANRPFEEKIKLKYSNVEECVKVEDVKHPIVREVLRLFNLNSPQIEIGSMADIPASTGLGSSGSFATSLIKVLSVHYRRNMNALEIAEMACKVEIEVLGEPVGKQDQYISAIGGITEFRFMQDGTVKSNPVDLSMNTIFQLEDNLLLFFTGISRSASKILSDQSVRSIENDTEMIENLHHVKELGLRSKIALLNGDTEEFAKIMHEHWQHKLKRSKGMSNQFIDDAYKLGMENGAMGGKLVGAGGGGFLLFYAHDKKLLRESMGNIGLEEIRFKFDFEGTRVVLS
jgi:D-glycero-alpha-D-manno-heptose-7-phosphate kinase